MNELLAFLTMILVGALGAVGLGVMSFGVYCAVFTKPKEGTIWSWDALILVWIGRVTIAAGLLLVFLLLGHFIFWAVR